MARLVSAGRPLKARLADRSGLIRCDGVSIHYDVFGEADETIVLIPPWTIVHSRLWKAQIPFLARNFRVIAFDAPGNGRSSRPREPAKYGVDALVSYTLAVLDDTETARSAIVTLSLGAQCAVQLCARHPERFTKAAFIAPSIPLAEPHPERGLALAHFDQPRSSYEGWFKMNRHYWRRDYADFVRFFFETALCEPHSTKQIEDCIGWGLETSPEVLGLTIAAPMLDTSRAVALARDIVCPTLVVHGDCDAIVPHACGAALAEATGGTLVTMRGSGHMPQARHPVEVNERFRDFLRRDSEPRCPRAEKRRFWFVPRSVWDTPAATWP